MLRRPLVVLLLCVGFALNLTGSALANPEHAPVGDTPGDNLEDYDPVNALVLGMLGQMPGPNGEGLNNHPEIGTLDLSDGVEGYENALAHNPLCRGHDSPFGSHGGG